MTTTNKAKPARAVAVPATAKTTKLLNFPIPLDLHRKLRIAAIEHDLTVQSAVLRAIEEWIAQG